MSRSILTVAQGHGRLGSANLARQAPTGMHVQRRRHVALGYEPDAAAACGSTAAIDSPERLRFALVARFASAGDNCAVATRTIEAGSVIEMPSGRALRLDFTVLEGHRFAAQAIEAGELLLSWGSGFGRATRRINEGEAHDSAYADGTHLPRSRPSGQTWGAGGSDAASQKSPEGQPQTCLCAACGECPWRGEPQVWGGRLLAPTRRRALPGACV